MNHSINYQRGHCDRLRTGLAENLLVRGLEVSGKETIDRSLALTLKEQIELVVKAPLAHYWGMRAQAVSICHG